MKIRPIALPHGPRETIAKLRGEGHYAMHESALVMPRQAEWSYIAGPALATLYTDAGGTSLQRDGIGLAVIGCGAIGRIRAIQVRTLRYDSRTFRRNHCVTSTISGRTEKVIRARRQSSCSMMMMESTR